MAENYTEVPTTNEEEIDIVELKDETGKIMRFYHIGTIEHKQRWFAFFQPAEEIEGLTSEEVVIFEITGDDGNEALAAVEDEALLDEVYQAFISEMEDDDDCDCDCHGEDCDCDGDDCHCHGDDCDCGCHK